MWLARFGLTRLEEGWTHLVVASCPHTTSNNMESIFRVEYLPGHSLRRFENSNSVCFLANPTCIYCKSTMDLDPGIPRLPRRNVEVFDTDSGAVVAGTFFNALRPARSESICRVLAVWYSPVGWTSQILDKIRRFCGTLENFSIRLDSTTTRSRCAMSFECADRADRALHIALNWEFFLVLFPILLSVGESIRIGLVATLPRPRIPTISNTPSCVSEFVSTF